MAKKKTKEADDLDISADTINVTEGDGGVNAEAQMAMLKKITSSLNKTYGEGSAKINNSEYDNVADYVLTGVPVIDYLLGGKGFPVGRISEIYGPPSSGKTALAMHLLKTTIDRGGAAFMLDAEHAFSFSMAKNIGMDTNKLVYMDPTTLEEIWRKVESIISLMKMHASHQLCTIVVDSIASAPSAKELEKDISEHEMGERARINSKAIRKITAEIADNKICLVCLNQVRDAIGVMFGDNEIIPGGKALDFASSIKLRINKSKQITPEGDPKGEPIGQIVRVKINKNKVAPPFRSAELELFFDSGISKYSGLMEMMKEKNVLYKRGSYLAFRNLDGTEETFYAKDFEAFIESHPFLLDFSEWNKFTVVPSKEDE